MALVTATLSMLSCSPQVDEVEASPNSGLPEIDRLAATFMAERRVPGLAIWVLRGGEVIHGETYGVVDIDSGIPVAAQTAFDVGSIKKHVTAAVVLRLAERGVLSLDDPLARWLPELGVPTHVTLRHMLHQVSGLPESEDRAGLAELQFEPGSRFAYSNSNFDLLDEVIERASGSSFADLVRRELSAPLGLAVFEKCTEAGDPAAPRARGHSILDGAVSAVDSDCWFLASAPDLARWLSQLVVPGTVLSAESLEGWVRPSRLADGSEWPYGMGVDLRPFRGARRWSHTGHSGGQTSAFAVYPDHDLVVVVLGNSDGMYDPEALEMSVAGEVLQFTSSPQPTVDASPEPPEGVYDALSIYFEIETVKGVPVLTMRGRPGEDWKYVSLELRPLDERAWVAVDSPEAVRVGARRMENGRAQELWVDLVGARWSAVRVRDESP